MSNRDTNHLRHKNKRGIFDTRMWAVQFAHSIRRNIADSQPCRDRAIKAFLEVYLMVNPNFDDKRFRAIANGKLDDPLMDEYFEKWKARYALD